MLSPRRTAWLGLAVFAALLVGSSAAYRFLWNQPMREATEAERSPWMRVPCTFVEVIDVGDGGAASYRYEYQVAGVTHTGTRATFWGSACRTLHRVGDSASCFVDPADPSRAVLDPAYRPGPGLRLAIIAVMAVGAVGTLSFLAVRMNLLRIRPSLHESKRVAYRDLPR